MSTLEIEEKIMSLSDEEKLGLIDRMWKSMAPNTETPPDWHGDVLTERARQIESGEAQYLDWNDVKLRMQQRRIAR